MSSHWPQLADLELEIDGYELDRLTSDQFFEPGEKRVTVEIRLLGAGTDGLGEDIWLEPDALLAAGPSLPLAGRWTLGSFCAHLATLEQWPEPPEWESARLYRNWAYESAALDLALRQNGTGLPAALGIAPRPVSFVNSFGLGEPPAFAMVERRLERYPWLRFKLDAEPGWTPELIDALVATGAVDVVDLKGQYDQEVEDADALATMYTRVLERFTDALLEDPHDLPGIAELVAPHAGRVSYDAPIHAVADIAATAHRARTVNIKPSRTGSLAALFDLYDHCEREGLRMYGGGMGEIGVGRGQVQLLASLFHPDAPNDVAPSPFNGVELVDGLPVSPLIPPREQQGFRWEP